MSTGFLSKVSICSYMHAPTLFPLILIVIILFTLAFSFVSPGELRVTTMILSGMQHVSVFIVGLSMLWVVLPAGALASECDSLESCEADLHQRYYTRWLWNILTASSWQSKQVRIQCSTARLRGNLHHKL